MSLLKVFFLPWWSKNPYQKLLVKHLEQLGAEVKTFNHNHTIFLTPAVIQWRPDVIHFHTLYPFFLASNKFKFLCKFFTFFSQVLILKLMGVKIVWTIHDLKNHENIQVKFERTFNICFSRLAYAIITHCEIAKQEVIASFHLKKDDNIFVIPHANYVNYYENAIDRSEAQKTLGIKNAKLIFLFLGLLRGYKGVPELIDAFKQIEDDEVYLVIAGKASNELAEQINLTLRGYDKIKFIPGFVADDQVQVYMNACDVVVLPYRDILTSGSVILAMSFARACIAPRKGCIAEVLDERGGILYEPYDDNGIFKAIERAVQKKSALLCMGAHNRQVVEQWDWEGIAEMTFKAYQRF